MAEEETAETVCPRVSLRLRHVSGQDCLLTGNMCFRRPLEIQKQLWQYFLQLFSIHLLQVLCLSLPSCPCRCFSDEDLQQLGHQQLRVRVNSGPPVPEMEAEKPIHGVLRRERNGCKTFVEWSLHQYHSQIFGSEGK